jgi:hypothetical protein
MISSGDQVNPVPAKHSKSFSLIDCISVGVDRRPLDFRNQVRRSSGALALIGCRTTHFHRSRSWDKVQGTLRSSPRPWPFRRFAPKPQ